jgi:hypothetical protein
MYRLIDRDSYILQKKPIVGVFNVAIINGLYL